MTTTQALLADLRTAHPALDPQVIHKNETALVDDESVSDELVVVMVDGMIIHDLFVSSCGRFEVTPEEAYGVPLATAQRIKAHNRT